MTCSTTVPLPGKALSRLLALFLGFAALLSAPAEAHPSTSLNYRLLFTFEGSRITDIGESWTFDPLFSQELLSDYDKDGDGAFDQSETKIMGRDILANLSRSHYLTYITVDGRDLDAFVPFGFRARNSDGIVTIAFSNHLMAPLEASGSTIAVQVKDPGYVVLTAPAQNEPVILRGVTMDMCAVRILNSPAEAYTHGMITTQQVDLTCR